MKTSKTFFLKYEPTATPHQIFTNMWKAVDTGKSNIQPKNFLKSNSLEAFYRCITPSRWEIFACLVEKKPTNITELSRLLNKDYANIWKDIRALEGLEIIKLKKEGKNTRPIALYDRIVFDLKVSEKKEEKELPYHLIFENSSLVFKESIDNILASYGR